MKKRLTIKATAVCCQDLSLLADYALQGYSVDKKLLPAGLRRRAGLTTQMAVTAATRACAEASADPTMLPSVFASLGGEIQITDALCRTLPDTDALLSPTQFHNSVHNTTAGYWSILHDCQEPTTAIAAIDDTFAMGLLEAWSQLQQHPGDLLLVCYDEIWPQYLAPPIGKVPFVCALVLSNNNNDQSHCSISAPEIAATELSLEEDLITLIQSAPAAAGIPLLQAIAGPEKKCLVPLNISGAIWYTCLHKV